MFLFVSKGQWTRTPTRSKPRRPLSIWSKKRFVMSFHRLVTRAVSRLLDFRWMNINYGFEYFKKFEFKLNLFHLIPKSKYYVCVYNKDKCVFYLFYVCILWIMCILWINVCFKEIITTRTARKSESNFHFTKQSFP